MLQNELKTISIQEIKNEIGAHLTDEQAQEIAQNLLQLSLLTAKLIRYDNTRTT